MKLKKAAVLGLSALIMGGSLMPMTQQPATASSLMTGSRHIAQMARQQDELLMLALAQKAKKQQTGEDYRFWQQAFKPYAPLAGRHSFASFRPKTASFPIGPVTSFNPAIPTVQPQLNGSENEAVQTVEPASQIMGLSPEGLVGPAAPEPDMQPAPEPADEAATQPDEMKVNPPAASSSEATLIGPPAPVEKSSAKPAKQPSPEKPAAPAKKPSVAQAYGMLAMTAGLDGLQDFGPGSGNTYKIPLTPGGFNAPPDVMLDSGNAVTVLKSGISEKVTDVDLTLGKAQVIQLSRPASRVAVSNPDIASAVIISPTQIQLVGKSIGVSNLLIWGDLNSPNHTVVDVSVHRDVSVLVNQLKYVDPGIQIAPLAAEDSVILTGQAESRESAQLAIELAKAYFAKNSGGTTMAMGSPGNGSNSGPNSRMPGSSLPGQNTNVINLIKVKGEPSTKIEMVRLKMREIDPNIALEVVPGPDGTEKVILTGRVQTASLASKALNLASVFYGRPGIQMVTAQGGNMFTRMSSDKAGEINMGGVQNGGGSGGGGGSTTDTLGVGINMLNGSVMTDATGNVISMLEIAQKPQIRCNIKFLEISKSDLDQLGGNLSGGSGDTLFAHMSGAQSPSPSKPIASLSQNGAGSAWSANQATALSAPGSPVTSSLNGVHQFSQVLNNGVTQVFSLNQQFYAALSALEERKKSRTLAEPTLTLLSGEPGSFLAGGEVPIPFANGNGSVTIEYHEFGIRLNMIATVTDDGKIQMQLSPEVSSVDQANGVSTNFVSAPAFSTRRMQTTLLVNDQQSFVLAGLFKQDDIDSVSKFPGLGSVPVLGNFFRSKWRDKRNSEMVVIIKPEIMVSATGNTGPAELGFSPVNFKPGDVKPAANSSGEMKIIEPIHEMKPEAEKKDAAVSQN